MPRFATVGSALGLAAMLALATPATSQTTPTRKAPGGLRYCEDIDTFYKLNEAGGANGQCLPSMSPGAYYTKAGEKDANFPESDRQWLCFSHDFPKHLWTNKEARQQNFEGACLFGDYKNKKKVTPDDIEDCSNHLSHHPAVCSPGPSMYWGACWSSTSEQWKCIPNNDDTIPGLAKGDCKAQVLLHEDGTPTTSFYDGACRFKEEKVIKYRCDTVPAYTPGNPSTCGGGSPPDSACFTYHKEANWQCFQQDEVSTTPCEWTLLGTLLDGKKEFYKGACVFKGSDEYEDAKDVSELIAEEAQALEEKENREKEEEEEEKPEEPRNVPNSQAIEEEKPEEPRNVQNSQAIEEKHEKTTKNRASSLRNLKWRWAEHKIPGLDYYVPRVGIGDSWNMPSDRDALAKELEKKVRDPKAAAKQYATRAVEFADADDPKRRRTFADYTKALDWLALESNIQSRDDL